MGGKLTAVRTDFRPDSRLKKPDFRPKLAKFRFKLPKPVPTDFNGRLILYLLAKKDNLVKLFRYLT